MKLSSTHLEAFYAVAQARNFTKAAEKIHVTQSALSQRILNLESELQTTLFIRDPAGITLTEPAYELLRYCQVQERFESEFLGRLRSGRKSELSGVIRIAGFSSVMHSSILPSLRDLLIQNPSVRLQTYTREMRELLPMLKHGEADYIVTDKMIEREEIQSIRIGKERNVLTECDDYKGPDLYLDHDEHDETTRNYLKLTGKSQNKLERHYLDNIYGVIEGVKLGIGRAVIPEHLAEGLRIVQKNVVLETEVYAHFFRKSFYSSLHHGVMNSLKQGAPRALRAKRYNLSN